MGFLGFTSKKERQQLEQIKVEKEEILKAYEVLVEKASMLDPGNQWAQQVLSQINLHSGIPAFDYNLAKFINTGYIRNPNIYSVINKILTPAKNVPWIVYVVKDKIAFKRYQAFKAEGRINEAEVFATKALEAVYDTQLNKIFDEGPNPLQTWPEFVEACLGYYLLTGNNYIYEFIPSGFKFASQLYNLPAQAIEIIPGNYRDPVSGYQMAFGNTKQPIPADRVIHQKMFNPAWDYGSNINNYLYGMSPLAPLGRVTERSNQSIDASLALLLNGFPPGILSQDTGENGNPMKEKERKELENQWVSSKGGGHRANMPVFAAVKLLWQQMGLSPVDMDLLNSDKADVKKMANVYNVPLPLVSDDKATYSNMTEAYKALYQDAVIPHLTSLREALVKSYVRKYNISQGKEYWIDFDLKAVPVLREDEAKRSAMIMSEMEHCMYTVREALTILDRPIPANDDGFLDKRMLKSGLRFADEPLSSQQTSQQNATEETTTTATES